MWELNFFGWCVCLGKHFLGALFNQLSTVAIGCSTISCFVEYEKVSTHLSEVDDDMSIIGDH